MVADKKGSCELCDCIQGTRKSLAACFSRVVREHFIWLS